MCLIPSTVEVFSIQYLFLGNWGNPPLLQGNNENISYQQWGPCSLHLQPTQTHTPVPPPSHTWWTGEQNKSQYLQWEQWMRKCRETLINIDTQLMNAHKDKTTHGITWWKMHVLSFSNRCTHIHTQIYPDLHTYIYLFHDTLMKQPHNHILYDKHIIPDSVCLHTHTHLFKIECPP